MKDSPTVLDSWGKAELGQILPLKYGKGLIDKDRIQTGEIPVFGSSGVVGYHNKALIQGPTILVGRKGTVGPVHYSFGPCWPIDTTYYIETTRSTYLPFFSYLLKATDLAGMDRSTAIPGLSRRDYDDIEAAVPPLPEQYRIVAEIEKQFTRLGASVEGLRRAQANLKRYRASVLKAACEGKLVPTEAEMARDEGRDYEPASVLLERILVERRAKWEEDQLRNFDDAGKSPPKNWKERYKEPAALDTSDLPELPEGWVWATMEQLSEIQGGIQKQPKRAPADNPYPFLRVANVLRGSLDLDEVHQIEVFPGELDKLRLLPGDLLIVEGNGSPSQIGRMAIWKGDIEHCVHQNHIIRARLVGELSSKYAETYWNSPTGTSEVSRVASSTSGLYTLSVSKVSVLPIPLPPLAEQRRIVAKVERRLSVVQQAEATVEASSPTVLN